MKIDFNFHLITCGLFHTVNPFILPLQQNSIVNVGMNVTT
jgi:hypothetical protein